MTQQRVEKLTQAHAVETFDCGNEALNRFLHRYALTNQRANASQTYLGSRQQTILGFYTLVVGEVSFADAPERLAKGLARHPIPLMLLARMGVSVAHQRQGIGAGLLKDATLRTLQAADIAGIRALAVHAKDQDAQTFYKHFGFIESPTDPFHLFVLVKDLKSITA